jgi:NAD(P)-dependent dehydrogenase (short-subunit alcohol dehydrogenase family)
MGLIDRVAVVTGSTRGIGKAIALALAQRGAKVVVADIAPEEEMYQVVEEIRSLGVDGISVHTDTRKLADAKVLIEKTVSTFGRVDILVNNAGIIRDRRFLNMSEEEWDTVLETNLKGYFLCAQAATKYMVEHSYGRIINIGSRGWLGSKGQANYCASKAGVVGLTRALALELGKYQITVNCIAPGVIDTPLFRSLKPDVQENLYKSQPTGKIGSPQDVAFGAVFFASDEASFITGQILYVCGGKSLGIVW